MGAFYSPGPAILSFPDFATTKLQNMCMMTCEDGLRVIVYAWLLDCTLYLFPLAFLSLICSLGEDCYDGVHIVVYI